MTVWARIKQLLRASRQRSSREPNTNTTNEISPVDRLPLEILSIIFLYLLPAFGEWYPERVPGALSQVCQRWRALTLALPALWASLNITCSRSILHPQLDTIHTHLQRSAELPLSIVLNTYNPDYYAATPNHRFPAVLAALVTARSRWRYVSIKLVSQVTEEMLDAITQGDAPLLEMFCCEIEEHIFPELPPIPLRALQGCPRLESLAWYCIRAPLSPALGVNTWPELTTLRLEASLTASDCLTLLQLSPRLSTAEFQEISPGVNPSFHLLHTTLHTLHATGAHAHTIIAALTLPALADLLLNIPPARRPAAQDSALPALLSRSTPPLRALSLTNLHVPETALLHALALAPKLRSLSVTESGPDRVRLTPALAFALHPSPSSSRAGRPLCPRLSTLRLSGALEAPDGTWTSILRARWGAAARANKVVCLKEAHIALVGNIPARDYAEMARLNKEGMVGTFSRAH